MAATPAGSMGHLSTPECTYLTYLPTYLGERRQLLNLRSDTPVRFVHWIHLLQSFQEVAPVGALKEFPLHDVLMSVHSVRTSAYC